MDFRSITTLLLALSLSVTPVAAQSLRVGLTQLPIQADEGDRSTEGFLWYPTEERALDLPMHGNAVIEPIRVAPGAEPAAGRYPLLVLSHGLFGNAGNQAWLAAGLVPEGFVVAAVNHPGTSTFQRDPAQRRSLWRRPRDISRAIDQVLATPGIGDLVDQERIFMAGHSLGGFTAMALAGARYDKTHFDAVCADIPGDRACELFGGWGIAETPEDKAMMEADLSDPRIAAFAVFDLGGTQTFSPESLGAIDRPLLVYGAPRDIHGLDLDVESRALVAALPSDEVDYLEPPRLAHFDFLGVCTENAIAILLEEEPDDVFICREGRAERKAEHARIVRQVLDFFNRH